MQLEMAPAHDGSGVNEPDHVPLIERIGNDAAAMSQELERQKEIVAELLKHVGRKGFCSRRKCGQPVLYVWHTDASCFRPYNLDGSSHFETCVDQKPSRRRKTDAADSTSKRDRSASQ
jgi:hypothetical protein